MWFRSQDGCRLINAENIKSIDKVTVKSQLAKDTRTYLFIDNDESCGVVGVFKNDEDAKEVLNHLSSNIFKDRVLKIKNDPEDLAILE